jgi:nitroimidazol reductase NimA-like FMN-containing flavoprotein (pyridoxamine 5'-phosphate oxidase superfamily)
VVGEQVLVTMLEESEEISQQLLDTVLGCLLKPASVDQPAAYRWVTGTGQYVVCTDDRECQPSCISVARTELRQKVRA